MSKSPCSTDNRSHQEQPLGPTELSATNSKAIGAAASPLFEPDFFSQQKTPTPPLATAASKPTVDTAQTPSTTEAAANSKVTYFQLLRQAIDDKDYEKVIWLRKVQYAYLCSKEKRKRTLQAPKAIYNNAKIANRSLKQFEYYTAQASVYEEGFSAADTLGYHFTNLSRFLISEPARGTVDPISGKAESGSIALWNFNTSLKTFGSSLRVVEYFREPNKNVNNNFDCFINVITAAAASLAIVSLFISLPMSGVALASLASLSSLVRGTVGFTRSLYRLLRTDNMDAVKGYSKELVGSLVKVMMFIVFTALIAAGPPGLIISTVLMIVLSAPDIKAFLQGVPYIRDIPKAVGKLWRKVPEKYRKKVSAFFHPIKYLLSPLVKGVSALIMIFDKCFNALVQQIIHWKLKSHLKTHQADRTAGQELDLDSIPIESFRVNYDKRLETVLETFADEAFAQRRRRPKKPPFDRYAAPWNEKNRMLRKMQIVEDSFLQKEMVKALTHALLAERNTRIEQGEDANRIDLQQLLQENNKQLLRQALASVQKLPKRGQAHFQEMAGLAGIDLFVCDEASQQFLYSNLQHGVKDNFWKALTEKLTSSAVGQQLSKVDGLDDADQQKLNTLIKEEVPRTIEKNICTRLQELSATERKQLFGSKKPLPAELSMTTNFETAQQQQVPLTQILRNTAPDSARINKIKALNDLYRKYNRRYPVHFATHLWVEHIEYMENQFEDILPEESKEATKLYKARLKQNKRLNQLHHSLHKQRQLVDKIRDHQKQFKSLPGRDFCSFNQQTAYQALQEVKSMLSLYQDSNSLHNKLHQLHHALLEINKTLAELSTGPNSLQCDNNSLDNLLLLCKENYQDDARCKEKTQLKTLQAIFQLKTKQDQLLDDSQKGLLSLVESQQMTAAQKEHFERIFGSNSELETDEEDSNSVASVEAASNNKMIMDIDDFSFLISADPQKASLLLQQFSHCLATDDSPKAVQLASIGKKLAAIDRLQTLFTVCEKAYDSQHGLRLVTFHNLKLKLGLYHRKTDKHQGAFTGAQTSYFKSVAGFTKELEQLYEMYIETSSSQSFGLEVLELIAIKRRSLASKKHSNETAVNSDLADENSSVDGQSYLSSEDEENSNDTASTTASVVSAHNHDSELTASAEPEKSYLPWKKIRYRKQRALQELEAIVFKALAHPEQVSNADLHKVNEIKNKHFSTGFTFWSNRSEVADLIDYTTIFLKKVRYSQANKSHPVAECETCETNADDNSTPSSANSASSCMPLPIQQSETTSQAKTFDQITLNPEVLQNDENPYPEVIPFEALQQQEKTMTSNDNEPSQYVAANNLLLLSKSQKNTPKQPLLPGKHNKAQTPPPFSCSTPTTYFK